MTAFAHTPQTTRLLPRKLPRGTILNRRGEPVVALTAPSGAVDPTNRLARINAAREYLNPLRGLTIARAISMLEDYQLGRMADLQWCYFFAEQTDADMIALLALRIGRLLEMDYNIDQEEESDDGLFARQRDLLVEKLAAIDNLYEAIEHLAMAPFRGFAHAEKCYNPAGEIHHLEIVDQWNVVRDGMRGGWKYNPTARTTDFLGCSGAALPMEQFLCREARRPINRFALLKFVRGGLADKDWDAFNEIYNVPGGVVTGPPDVDPEDEAEYESAARRVAEGGSGYLPHGSTYTPNAMPHDPGTFKLRLDYLSEKLVLAGTGGKLTMLTAAGSGTLAGGAHSEVFDRIAAAEARRISEIINRQLVAEWLGDAFPGQPQVAYFTLAANEEQNSTAAVDEVSKLCQAGYQVDPEQVAQRTGWIVTLKPATAPFDPAGQPAPDAFLANRRVLRNSAAVAAGEARFDAHAVDLLSAADRLRLAPLQSRVDAVRAAATPEAYATALAELKAALPALERDLLVGRPYLATAFEQIFATAFANGAAQAASLVKNRQSAATPTKPKSGPFPKNGHLRASGPGYRPLKRA